MSGFLSKCENGFDFAMTNQNHRKNDKNIELELFFPNLCLLLDPTQVKRLNGAMFGAFTVNTIL